MPGLVHGSDGHARGFRRIVFLLVWLVIVPTGLLLALGILMLVFWQAELNIVFGILVFTLVGCLVTGTVLSLVFLRREANLAKLQTDFVSKVSHELKTPLTSIRMFTDMLQTEQDPEQKQICYDVLQKETSRLSHRIDRLLDWGRMEAGRRVYDRKPDSVEAIVQDALKAHDTATVGRGRQIEVAIEPGLPPVMADRAAMVDALVNLLSNAWKYTGDDKEITLSASADARAIRISVRDNGQGIPRAEHRRIFDKFYRANDLLSREIEGFGLGLSIVRHVARGHDGRVELESQVGHGSTFTIVLPPAPSAPETAGLAAGETVTAG